MQSFKNSRGLFDVERQIELAARPGFRIAEHQIPQGIGEYDFVPLT